MAVLATDTQRLSNLIKKTDADLLEFFTKAVVANEAAATTYQIGTVLGQVTATGKYKVAVQTAVDGSQTPAAIVIADGFGTYGPVSVAATTDTKVLVVKRGKMIVSAGALFLDPSFTAGALTTAAYASLEALGIIVDTTI